MRLKGCKMVVLSDFKESCQKCGMVLNIFKEKKKVKLEQFLAFDSKNWGCYNTNSCLVVLASCFDRSFCYKPFFVPQNLK